MKRFLDQEREIKFWNNLIRPEELGTQVAEEAEKVRDFIANLEPDDFGGCFTKHFDNYMLGLVAKYQRYECKEGDISILITLDLHSIIFHGYTINFFYRWLKNEVWIKRLMYAYQVAKIPNFL